MHASSHGKLLGLFFIVMFLTGCNSAYKQDITYRVDFNADNVAYSTTTSFAYYHGHNFSHDFDTVDYNKSSIDGTLRDGTRYTIGFYNLHYQEIGSHNINSRIYLLVSKNIVESFDNEHTHSPHHTIHITKSYVIVGSPHKAWYRTAQNAQHAFYTSARTSRYYYTVGAKITPFHDAEQAVNDFYNMGPPSYPVPQDYKPPSFNFHPGDAGMENSDADITYDGKFFDVKFPNTKLATTWVLAPGIHPDGIAMSGSMPNITVKFNGNRIIVNPLGHMANASIDTATTKAVLFYECNAALDF